MTAVKPGSYFMPMPKRSECDVNLTSQPSFRSNPSQVSRAELNCCKLFVANLWHQHSLRNSVCRKYEPASYEVICFHCLCSSEHAHNVKNNGFIHYIYFHLLTLKTTKLQSSLFCDGRVRVSQILYQLLFRFNLRMGGALPTPPFRL